LPEKEHKVNRQRAGVTTQETGLKPATMRTRAKHRGLFVKEEDAGRREGMMASRGDAKLVRVARNIVTAAADDVQGQHQEFQHAAFAAATK